MDRRYDSILIVQNLDIEEKYGIKIREAKENDKKCF